MPNPYRFHVTPCGDADQDARRVEHFRFNRVLVLYRDLSEAPPNSGFASMLREQTRQAKQAWAESLQQLDGAL